MLCLSHGTHEGLEISRLCIKGDHRAIFGKTIEEGRIPIVHRATEVLEKDQRGSRWFSEASTRTSRTTRDLHVILESRWWLRQVELVLSKTIHVLAHIRRQCSYCLLVSFSPFLIQLFSNLADGVNVVENETIGHEVMKFTTRALFRIPKLTDCPRKEQSFLDNDDYHYNK